MVAHAARRQVLWAFLRHQPENRTTADTPFCAEEGEFEGDSPTEEIAAPLSCRWLLWRS
jgi:hypothetical protein